MAIWLQVELRCDGEDCKEVVEGVTSLKAMLDDGYVELPRGWQWASGDRAHCAACHEKWRAYQRQRGQERDARYEASERHELERLRKKYEGDDDGD